jgi:hypothetical protein
VLPRDDREHGHVTLVVGRDRAGEAVREQVPASQVHGRRYRLLASPALGLDVAAGDLIDLADDGAYSVVERGGNVCVQVYYRGSDLEGRVDAELVPAVIAAGGWLDGRIPDGVSAFTIPASVGFPAIERLMNAFVARAAGAEWSYGNVYADDGVTPLGWWESPPSTRRSEP